MLIHKIINFIEKEIKETEVIKSSIKLLETWQIILIILVTIY